MFGLKKAETKTEEFSTPYVPPAANNVVSLMERRPKPIEVKLPELTDLSEYEQVASVLGFNPPEIAKRKLEIARREVIEFCLDKGYPIYDNLAVHAFMAELAERDGKLFCWARLRGNSPEERSTIQRAQLQEMQFMEALQNARMAGMGGVLSGYAAPPPPPPPHVVSRREHGIIVPSAYQKAVPLEMLKRAATLKERFGEEVEFYVSDFAVVDPDPFIMVKRGHCEHIVFGVWDEPGFGLK